MFPSQKSIYASFFDLAHPKGMYREQGPLVHPTRNGSTGCHSRAGHRPNTMVSEGAFFGTRLHQNVLLVRDIAEQDIPGGSLVQKYPLNTILLGHWAEQL